MNIESFNGWLYDTIDEYSDYELGLYTVKKIFEKFLDQEFSDSYVLDYFKYTNGNHVQSLIEGIGLGLKNIDTSFFSINRMASYYADKMREAGNANLPNDLNRIRKGIIQYFTKGIIGNDFITESIDTVVDIVDQTNRTIKNTANAYNVTTEAMFSKYFIPTMKYVIPLAIIAFGIRYVINTKNVFKR